MSDEQHSSLGYSAVSEFQQCPYRYWLEHISRIDTLPTDDAQNALIVGTALHKGVETDADIAIAEYYNSYPIITDKHIEEAMKLSAMIPKVKAIIPDGEHELFIEAPNFKGTIDLLADGCIYDFKYCSIKNKSRYMDSPQLHLYKHYYEQAYHGEHIDHLYYVLVPKCFAKQRKTETVLQFRARMMDEVAKIEPEIVEVPYNPSNVIAHLEATQVILQADDYPKKPSRLCDWCQYQDYCEKGKDYMLLPKNERRTISATKRRRIWVYGAPFTGKTTLANAFPNVLMLNSDGNVQFVDAPFIPIKDEVTVEGRLTRKTLAWQVFKDAIDELEKKQNDFETIVVDLAEDMHEYCRLYMYDKKGWEHESDDSFRAYDMVRTEYLSTMKRLMNLDYTNVVLISHEDTSKDITKRTGSKITAIKPNMNDKVANKLAGMVDIVARAVVEDGEHRLQFKQDEVTFGGGRLKLSSDDIPMDYGALMEVYDSGQPHTDKPARKAKPAAEPAPEPEPQPEPEPTVGETVTLSEAIGYAQAEIIAESPELMEGQRLPEPVSEPPARRVRKRRTTVSGEE